MQCTIEPSPLNRLVSRTWCYRCLYFHAAGMEYLDARGQQVFFWPDSDFCLPNPTLSPSPPAPLSFQQHHPPMPRHPPHSNLFLQHLHGGQPINPQLSDHHVISDPEPTQLYVEVGMFPVHPSHLLFRSLFAFKKAPLLPFKSKKALTWASPDLGDM